MASTAHPMACSPKLFHRPFRARNKEPLHLDPCPPLFDDHRTSLFDEYLDSDLFEPSDTAVGTAHSDDSSNLSDFATSSGASDAADLPADARHHHAAAPARQGSLASLEQKLHIPHINAHPQGDGADRLVHVDHLSLDDFSCAVPVSSPIVGVELSPPPSPTPELSISKKRIALPIRSITGAKSPIRKLQRMCSQSPTKMMSPRHQRVGTYHGAWARKLEAASEKFNSTATVSPMAGGQATPMSPPNYATTTAHRQSPRARTFVPSDFRGFDAAPLATPGSLEEPISPTSHAMHNPYLAQSQQALLTPLTSPTFPLGSPMAGTPQQMQHHHQSMSFSPAQLHGNHEANAALLHTPPPSQKLPSTPWNPEHPDFLDYSYSATSTPLTDHRAEAWWNAASAMHSTHQLSNCSANPTLIGLGLEGLAASDLDAHTGSNVLGQCDMSGLALDSLLHSSAPGLPDVAASTFTSPFLYDPVPALMPTTPITPSHTYHRSRNSSASPTPVTPSSARHMRGASRSHRRSQSQHHRRRPSVRDIDLSSAGGASTAQGAGGAGAAKGGSGSGSGANTKEARDRSAANVGFVNFTPDDSRKILTGVAPSGSSKTKARREKEAQEKRRKLSEAARRAVVEAGGDVERLEREGLLASIMAADA